MSDGFYSYDSKYIDGQAAQVVVPAAISLTPASGSAAWPLSV